MSSEWMEVEIGDLVVVKHGFAFKGENFSQVQTLHQLVTPGNFSLGGGFQLGKGKFYSGPIPEDYVLQCGDLVVTMTDLSKAADTLGFAALVPETKGTIWLHNQRVGLVQRKPNAPVDLSFLHYVMRSSAYRHWIVSSASGSTVKHTSPGRICSYRFLIPPLSEQQSVAQMLSTLDDRITLLRESSATLEAIAQALFKSWFIDFDPVRAKMEGRAPEGMDEATAALFPDELEESTLGPMPRGWTVTPIGNAVSVAGGATPDTKNTAFWDDGIHPWTTPKDLSGIASPVLLDTERKLSAAGLAKIGSGLLPKQTLLLSSRAPIGYLALADLPVAINQGYIAMLPGGLLPPLYLLFWCQQNMDVIKGRANGSTFMEISKKAFRPIPILLPPSAIVTAFIAVAESLFDRLVKNEKQAQTLATLRDALLPRLISGQLRLSENTEALSEEICASSR